VVYAGDYQRLVENVLGEEYFRPAFVDKLKRSRRTEAMLNVFLGINLPAEELKKLMQAHHVLYWPDLKVMIPGPDSPRDVHQKAWMELSSPSQENPKLAPPGKSSLVLQTFTNIKWQNYWQNGSESTERTPEYREFKKAVGMELVKGAEAVIPGLSEKIEYMDVGTPLSAIRFTMNSQGASAGWTYNLPDLPIAGKFGFTSFQSPVGGLYTIGQYSFWPGGVPNSALSGKIVANSILGKFPEGQIHTAVDLFRKLKKLF
jgi:phytoene dehydrogenase-like protein